jgi:hypothetical protein
VFVAAIPDSDLRRVGAAHPLYVLFHCEDVGKVGIEGQRNRGIRIGPVRLRCPVRLLPLRSLAPALLPHRFNLILDLAQRLWLPLVLTSNVLGKRSLGI